MQSTDITEKYDEIMSVCPNDDEGDEALLLWSINRSGALKG